MPSFSRSCSTELNRPCRDRQSRMRCAVTGPTPGRMSSCSTVARFQVDLPVPVPVRPSPHLPAATPPVVAHAPTVRHPASPVAVGSPTTICRRPRPVEPGSAGEVGAAQRAPAWNRATVEQLDILPGWGRSPRSASWTGGPGTADSARLERCARTRARGTAVQPAPGSGDAVIRGEPAQRAPVDLRLNPGGPAQAGWRSSSGSPRGGRPRPGSEWSPRPGRAVRRNQGDPGGALPGVLRVLAAAGCVTAAGRVITAVAYQLRAPPAAPGARTAPARRPSGGAPGDPMPVFSGGAAGGTEAVRRSRPGGHPRALVSASAAGADWTVGGRLLLLAPRDGWAELLPGSS